jgi:large subunit ribosomal protein L2
MYLQTANFEIPSLKNYMSLPEKNIKFHPFIKHKRKGTKNSTGTNISGRIVSYHKGGGHKKVYRKINFHRCQNSTGIVTTIEYDPNRTANIAAIYELTNKSYYYILAPKNLRVGDIVKSGLDAELKLGHSLPIQKIPVGSFIHSVSSKFKGLGQIARSAGTSAKLLQKNSRSSLIQLPSGKHKSLLIQCYATLGAVSNEAHWLITLKKAGRSRWLNKRPTVRGVAMNPVDHPHGGGEGKKSGLKLSPWGKPTKKKLVRKNY